MNEIGKHRNPAILIILTVISFGLYGFAWFVFVLEELRKYRGKGVSGVVPVALIIISSLVVLFFGLRVPELVYFPLICAVFFGIYLFALPILIEIEINKLQKVKHHWYIIGILVLIAFTSFLAAPYYAETLCELTWIEELFGFLLLFLTVLPGLFWIYYAQKRLNLLWNLNDISNSFAIPEMANADKSVPEAFSTQPDTNSN